MLLASTYSASIVMLLTGLDSAMPFCFQIYNNGYLSLGMGHTGGFTPRAFPFSGPPMIAPYWADADATVGSGRTYYRVSSRRVDRARGAQLIQSVFPAATAPLQVIVVTWKSVGYFRDHQDKA